MGARTNVCLNFPPEWKDDEKPDPIYFYSHWAGESMPFIVARALDRGRDRWDDPQYLARIIFDEMIRGLEHENAGAGIAPWPGEEQYNTVYVDLAGKTAGIADNMKPYEKYIEYWSEEKKEEEKKTPSATKEA